MKLFLPLALLLSLSTAAQENETSEPGKEQTVTSPKTYGYVGGTRLDSIDADYGQLMLGSLIGLQFDYGQPRSKRKELVLTDKEGRKLVFESGTMVTLLNFFSFNGWELAQPYNGTTASADSYLLKKKKA